MPEYGGEGHDAALGPANFGDKKFAVSFYRAILIRTFRVAILILVHLKITAIILSRFG